MVAESGMGVLAKKMQQGVSEMLQRK